MIVWPLRSYLPDVNPAPASGGRCEELRAKMKTVSSCIGFVAKDGKDSQDHRWKFSSCGKQRSSTSLHHRRKTWTAFLPPLLDRYHSSPGRSPFTVLRADIGFCAAVMPRPVTWCKNICPLALTAEPVKTTGVSGPPVGVDVAAVNFQDRVIFPVVLSGQAKPGQVVQCRIDSRRSSHVLIFGRHRISGIVQRELFCFLPRPCAIIYNCAGESLSIGQDCPEKQVVVNIDVHCQAVATQRNHAARQTIQLC